MSQLDQPMDMKSTYYNGYTTGADTTHRGSEFRKSKYKLKDRLYRIWH